MHPHSRAVSDLWREALHDLAVPTHKDTCQFLRCEQISDQTNLMLLTATIEHLVLNDRSEGEGRTPSGNTHP